MNYGLQLAASGALTSLYRMDVLANNLANVSTVAFKPDIPGLKQRDAERIEKSPGLPSNKLLERLGGGVFSSPNRIQFTQGTLTQSSNPFDTGIQGEGFFVMRDESAPGKDSLRLSRDGRFTRDANSRLVSATTGYPVLDSSGRPITLRPDAPVQIQPGGAVQQGGETVAQIQLVSPADLTRLTKFGMGMYKAPDTLRPANGQIQQHFVEGSAVDPVSALMAINDAAKAAEGNFALINGHDRLLDRAINGLGRVS